MVTVTSDHHIDMTDSDADWFEESVDKLGDDMMIIKWLAEHKKGLTGCYTKIRMGIKFQKSEDFAYFKLSFDKEGSLRGE